MKSKKIHKVILKTAKIRRARNNLRIIFKLAINEELSKLQELRSLYTYKKNLTPSQKKRRSQLSKSWYGLYHRFIRSTLRCNNGGDVFHFKKQNYTGLILKTVQPTSTLYGCLGLKNGSVQAVLRLFAMMK